MGFPIHFAIRPGAFAAAKIKPLGVELVESILERGNIGLSAYVQIKENKIMTMDPSYTLGAERWLNPFWKEKFGTPP